MSSVKRIQFTESIAAPVEKVFELMIDLESYKTWPSAFTEGSYFEGSWQEGQRIKFLSPSGHGMIAEIAERRPNESTEATQGNLLSPVAPNPSFNRTRSG